MTIESQYMTIKQIAKMIGCTEQLLRYAKESRYARKFPKEHRFKGRMRHKYYRRCEVMQWLINERPKEKGVYFYRYGGTEAIEIKNNIERKEQERSIEHIFIFGKRPANFTGKGTSKCVHVKELDDFEGN